MTLRLAIIALVMIISSISNAWQAKLKWTPSTEQVDGYKIHWQSRGYDFGDYIASIFQEGGKFDRSIVVGNVSSATISNLSSGRTYWFSATAYRNSSSSDYSNVVAAGRMSVYSGAWKTVLTINSAQSGVFRPVSARLYTSGSWKNIQ